MTNMDQASFVVDVVRLWRGHGCMNIDGCDFQELLIKHGLCSDASATEEDCNTDWGREYEVKVGYPVFHDHPDLKALMKERAK